MPKPQIFISHSTTGDQDATSVLDVLSTALDGAEFEVLVDKQRLQLGDNWRRQLHLWMLQCHGAIILFSKGALESDWVFYESTMLTARKYLEPDFTLIPVLLSSVKREDLAKGRFSPMVINELHQPARTDTLDVTVSEIICRLTLLRQRLCDAPLEKLVRVMAPWLGHLDRDMLQDVAKELEAQVEAWPLDKNTCRMLLIRELLKADLFKVCQALKILAPHLNEKHASNILTILAPSWIDERAVAAIPEVVKRPPQQRAICINSERTLTGEMYVRRACNTFPSWPTLKVNNIYAEDQFGTIVKEIRAEAKKKMAVFSDDITNEDIDGWLNDSSEGLSPRVVVVREYLDDETLTRLRQKYPRITFCLLSGKEEPDIYELKLKYIEFLVPKIDPRQEEKAFTLCIEASTIIGGDR